MKIFPAVDIREGRAVRLREGDYSRMTVYGDPVSAARSFLADGAGAVHVVDLDGALTGRPENAPVVAEIAALGMETEIGGGIRSRDSIEMYLAAGASRVILGTVAAEDPAFAEECIRAYGDRIAVGVDARDGKVAVRRDRLHRHLPRRYALRHEHPCLPQAREDPRAQDRRVRRAD